MPKQLCSADDPLWPEMRRAGITARDLPVIMGLVSYDSPWALYHRKTGALPGQEQPARLRYGSWLEAAIFEEWMGWGEGWYSHGDRGRLWQNGERPWQRATVSALVCSDVNLTDPVAVLECMTPATREGWGPDGTGQVPARVRARMLWRMDTLGVATGHVAACFLPSGEFRSYAITDDDCSLGIATMRVAARTFYRRIVGELGPPPVDHLTVTTKALQDVYAGVDDTLQAQVEQELIDQWVTARAMARVASDDAVLLTNRLRAAMGRAGAAVLADGTPVVRRTISKRAGYEVGPGVQDKLHALHPAANESVTHD
jgi:predicted phage-related endonuclease